MKHRIQIAVFSLFCAGLLFFAPDTFAELKLAPLITENMVLQRDMNVLIWGTDEPGTKITVAISDQKAAVTADDTGNWKVSLKPMKAGGPFEMTIQGSDSQTIGNILVGDVWVCSGQSNMEFVVDSLKNAKEEVKNADYPNIRLFTVPRKNSGKPLKAIKGRWRVCKRGSIKNFSAIAYFFGRQLNADLNVAIGLIDTSFGGTPVESWTRREVLAADFKPILESWDNSQKSYKEKKGSL